MKSLNRGKHSRTNSADPCEILEDLGRLVKGYAESSVATPPIPPKPSGSRRIDKIANDVFYLAMRMFVAESQAVSVLRAQETSPTPQLSPMDAEITDVDPVQASRTKLRVEIPPNYLSSLLVPVMSPPPSSDEFKDPPHTVRGIRDPVDVWTSEIRQLKTRLDRKEVTCEHPPAAEPKSPEVVELETELDETKSTLQDIRMRGQSLQTRNDVLARQAERVKSACGLLLEGHYDEASWKGVFYESSSLLQSHPLSRLRIRLAQFTSQLTSALKAFHDDGTWTPVTTGGLGSSFQEICDLLNDLMGHAEAQYLPPAKSRARSHSVPVATGNGYPTRPPSYRSITCKLHQMSASNSGPPIEGDSETLQVAQDIMRLASSPWSSPTPESLEMALAIYQSARRIQSPNPPGYETSGSNEELRATRQELRETREETGRAIRALNERLEHLVNTPVGQSYKSDTIAESVEEEAAISSVTEATVDGTAEAEEPTMISTELRREVVLSLIQATNTRISSETSSETATQVLEPEPAPVPQAPEGRWAPTSVGRNRLSVDDSSPELVERKVILLLNKLSTENFDSVSDQIVQWANKSEHEKDCSILILVIRLIFEKATDEAHWAEMYARLCKKMMDTLSPNVRADNAVNKDGEPVIGGQLFRRFLLMRCQDEFQHGWFDETTQEVPELGTAEYYTRAKVKRQGLGLVRFIGELFKLQMLTERVIHECIKKLLPSDSDDPREAEIETLCKLLTTVGERIDVPKSKAYMDIYFGRIGVVANNNRVASRIRYMILDVIELRQRQWKPRSPETETPPATQTHYQSPQIHYQSPRTNFLGRRTSPW